MTREAAVELVACVAVGLWGSDSAIHGRWIEFGAAALLAFLLVFLTESRGV